MLSFVLCSGWTSAQIGPNDVLIDRARYEKLKRKADEAERSNKRLDSLKSIIYQLKTEHTAVLQRSARELVHNQDQISEAQVQAQRYKLYFDEQRKQTNKYRYAYQMSGSVREKLTTSLLWGGFMSAAFILSLNDNKPAAGYIVAAGGAATTLTLAILLSKKPRKVPGL